MRHLIYLRFDKYVYHLFLTAPGLQLFIFSKLINGILKSHIFLLTPWSSIYRLSLHLWSCIRSYSQKIGQNFWYEIWRKRETELYIILIIRDFWINILWINIFLFYILKFFHRHDVNLKKDYILLLILLQLLQ